MSDDEMSKMALHANEELYKHGLYDDDADYGGLLGSSVMEIIHTLSRQGHSGGSLDMTLQLVNKLARFEHLDGPSSVGNDTVTPGDLEAKVRSILSQMMESTVDENVRLEAIKLAKDYM